MFHSGNNHQTNNYAGNLRYDHFWKIMICKIVVTYHKKKLEIEFMNTAFDIKVKRLNVIEKLFSGP